MTASGAFRCTICDAPMGTCSCWTPCDCGWFFRAGGKCRNPEHFSSVPGDDQ